MCSLLLLLKKKCQGMTRSISTMMYLDLYKKATRQDKLVWQLPQEFLIAFPLHRHHFGGTQMLLLRYY